jgi:hypothetical protein
MHGELLESLIPKAQVPPPIPLAEVPPTIPQAAVLPTNPLSEDVVEDLKSYGLIPEDIARLGGVVTYGQEDHAKKWGFSTLLLGVIAPIVLLVDDEEVRGWLITLLSASAFGNFLKYSRNREDHVGQLTGLIQGAAIAAQVHKNDPNLVIDACSFISNTIVFKLDVAELLVLTHFLEKSGRRTSSEKISVVLNTVQLLCLALPTAYLATADEAAGWKSMVGGTYFEDSYVQAPVMAVAFLCSFAFLARSLQALTQTIVSTVTEAHSAQEGEKLNTLLREIFNFSDDDENSKKIRKVLVRGVLLAVALFVSFVSQISSVDEFLTNLVDFIPAFQFMVKPSKPLFSILAKIARVLVSTQKVVIIGDKLIDGLVAGIASSSQSTQGKTSITQYLWDYGLRQSMRSAAPLDRVKMRKVFNNKATEAKVADTYAVAYWNKQADCYEKARGALFAVCVMFMAVIAGPIAALGNGYGNGEVAEAGAQDADESGMLALWCNGSVSAMVSLVSVYYTYFDHRMIWQGPEKTTDLQQMGASYSPPAGSVDDSSDRESLLSLSAEEPSLVQGATSDIVEDKFVFEADHRSPSEDESDDSNGTFFGDLFDEKDTISDIENARLAQMQEGNGGSNNVTRPPSRNSDRKGPGEGSSSGRRGGSWGMDPRLFVPFGNTKDDEDLLSLFASSV